MNAAIECPSSNFDARPTDTPIDMLVLHYTGMADRDAALARLCDAAAKVSAHYLIDEAGAVYRLVAEEMRAWHAGESFWRGARDVNARSIGIELVNPGHEIGYRPFPEAQMAALETLARDVVSRHGIAARNVVGHSDVAPRRRRDPGELFAWRRLAGRGVGLWPAHARPRAASAAEVARLLAAIGYETEVPAASIAAFQRRYRPAAIDGGADAETVGLIDALLRLTG